MTQVLLTSEVAKAVNVHPNTVRLYEEWGYLPPIPRGENGYRQFSEEHLEQMRLARLALDVPWAGRELRQSAANLVRQAASRGANEGLEEVLALAYCHLALVRGELAQAEAAAGILQEWAQGDRPARKMSPLRIGQVAHLLHVTTDMLRNWERNGLIQVPRDPRNRYRLYWEPEIGRLRVIRLLLQAGYSTMAVLRMVRQMDRGRRDSLREVLNTPEPEEGILYAADRWLSTLAEQEERAEEIIAQLEQMGPG